MSEESKSGSGAADIAELLKGYVPVADYEAALEALQAASDERDTHKTESEKHSKRAGELEGKVRSRTYRDSFEKLRKEAKVKDEFADDAYKLLGLSEDKDEPDEKAIKGALADFIKERKHYVDEPEPKKKTIPAGEGSQRGPSTSPGDPEFHVTHAELRDSDWTRDNQDKMITAKRAGLLVIDD